MIILYGKRKSKIPHVISNEDSHGTNVEIIDKQEKILVKNEFIISNFIVIIYERKTTWGITNREYQKTINSIEEAKKWIFDIVGGEWNYN